jgi:hypothetical protein
MSGRSRPRHTSRRPVPITDEQARELADCRCRVLEGTHQALHCAVIRAVIAMGGAR